MPDELTTAFWRLAAPLVLDFPRGKEVPVNDDEKRRPPDPAVGPLLLMARSKAGLSQAALAKQTGLSLSLISKVENGHRDLGRDALTKLVGVLGWEFGRAVLKTKKEAA